MAKFRHFEESRVRLGVGEIHIQEVDDGVNLTISEEIDDSIRIGIPDEHGTTYDYWRNIVKKLTDQSTIFAMDDSVEMAEDVVDIDEIKDKKSDTITKLRPNFVQYKDDQTEWIALHLKASNGDDLLISWEKDSDAPIPLITFNLDVIKKVSKIGQTAFYQEFQKICNRVLAGT